MTVTNGDLLHPITRWPDHPILSGPMAHDFRTIWGSEAFKAAASNAYNQTGSHFSSLIADLNG